MIGRCILVHFDAGIFLGHAMGLGFWSLLGDGGGQWEAPIFTTEASAREFGKATEGLDQSRFTVAAVPDTIPGNSLDILGLARIGVPECMFGCMPENDARHNRVGAMLGQVVAH